MASAEFALAAARQRLENAQRKHQDRLAVVRAKEAALAAPAPKAVNATVSDVTARAQRVLFWIDSITGTCKFQYVSLGVREPVDIGTVSYVLSP